MEFYQKIRITVIVFLGAFFLTGCAPEKKEKALFNTLTSDRTGLVFANKLTSSDSLNLFKYMYFYNGSGLAAGDFNNDGLIDLFFVSNQHGSSLFLNNGDLAFTDVTPATKIVQDGGWSTGVSVVDINNDGMLDIYVSRVGNYRNLKGNNLFLVCQGIKDGVPYYEDKAKEYKLDFSGFGTQAAFFDYDLDGDLDLFLLNHSVHENGTFRARHEFINTDHPGTGSILFKNDSGRFIDVTTESGILSSPIGFGLGIVVSDINLDGYPDIYIGNDFHENDYLYINQKGGRFVDLSAKSFMHTSQFTMGVDAADVNNDGFPDLVSADMLPADPVTLKRSLGEDNYNVFFLKISYGYNYQYSRNSLQLNRKNGSFSETGLYSGVAATDWSWAPLWIDFDNDGYKDLFVSNGIPKRMNDIDYINYISDQEIQLKIMNNKISEKDKVLIDKFPEIRIPNKFFKNGGDMIFTDLGKRIGREKPTYSNGAVYADFDNDGDLDVVVNNIDEDALLYQNTSNDSLANQYLQVTLEGPPGNRNALGSKLIVFSEETVLTYEKFPVRGFLSSMEIPIHVGLGDKRIDSVFLVWPDNSYQMVQIDGPNNRMQLKYQEGLPSFNYEIINNQEANSTHRVQDISGNTNLLHVHEENPFREFDTEPLMPHMASTEGPALAVGHMNADTLDDVFIGSARGRFSKLFIQRMEGRFEESVQAALQADSSYEDVDGLWTDVNNDGFADLVVASGGNESYGDDSLLLPRVYLNNAQGILKKKSDAFDSIYLTASCVAAHDFNGDGFVDLFIGGRAVAGEYGKVPRSYLLANDGTGRFNDVTARYNALISGAGFITDAVWVDISEDGRKDLILCAEWGTIDAYIATEERLTKKTLTDKKGWWNFILPCDLNGDGKIDLVAGNLGLNSRLKASEEEPVRMYYNDFDGNGKNEQILTYYVHGKEIPFANKAELESKIPTLRKQFMFAKEFAEASLKDIMTAKKLKESQVFVATYFGNAILMNGGNFNFELRPFPWQAQLTSYRDAVAVDADGDQYPDILLGGNFYENNIEMGRYDADYGSVLLNAGSDHVDYAALQGIKIKGQVRKIKPLTVGRQNALIIARNNDSLRVIQFDKKLKTF